MIPLPHWPPVELRWVGMASVAPVGNEVRRFRDHLGHNPYHAGEGIAGTVFQIGRPLLYSEFGGKPAADFARDATVIGERRIAVIHFETDEWNWRNLRAASFHAIASRVR